MSDIKVAYNACYGGFTLSDVAIERLKELGAGKLLEHGYAGYGLARHDPRLIQVIEELGDAASGSCAKLKVATINGDRYRIDEYDGKESVVESYEAEEEWIIVK